MHHTLPQVHTGRIHLTTSVQCFVLTWLQHALLADELAHPTITIYFTLWVGFNEAEPWRQQRTNHEDSFMVCCATAQKNRYYTKPRALLQREYPIKSILMFQIDNTAMYLCEIGLWPFIIKAIKRMHDFVIHIKTMIKVLKHKINVNIRTMQMYVIYKISLMRVSSANRRAGCRYCGQVINEL